MRTASFRKKFLLLLKHKHPFAPSPQIAYIYTKFQGQGIGQQLLTQAIQLIQEKKEKHLYVKTLLNSQALKFYQKNHFTIHRSFAYAGEEYALLISQ
jgi:ribosomal protein S18 acetylase RimI-like enzyme